MPAFADGAKSEVERAEMKRIAENFPESDVNLAALYHRVSCQQFPQMPTPRASQAPRTTRWRAARPVGLWGLCAAPHPACGHLLPRLEKKVSPVEAERE
jgi:hypothetical protein